MSTVKDIKTIVTENYRFHKYIAIGNILTVKVDKIANKSLCLERDNFFNHIFTF